MPLPESFKKKLRISPTFTIPFGEGVQLTIKRVKASEYRECEQKFAPKVKKGADDSDRRYMGAIRYGCIGVRYGDGPVEECTLTGDDIMELWQHAGRREASASAMEVMYQWGMVERGRENYLEQADRLEKAAIHSLTHQADEPEKKAKPAAEAEGDDPLLN